MSKLLSAEDILGADDVQMEKVEAWGGHLYVRVMSGEARDRWEADVYGSEKSFKDRMKNLRARLVAVTACDDKGELLFTPKQVDQLGRKSAKELDKVFAAASRINGLTKQDVDSLVGESEGGQNGDSGSD